MEPIDKSNSLADVKKRIADILHQNDIAIGEIPTEDVIDIPDNNTILKDKKQIHVFNHESNKALNRTMILKTNANGIIISVNNFFLDISVFKEVELMGQLYNINYHPDMPQVISDNVWAKLSNGENFRVLVKNLTREGHCFWSLNYFETIRDKNGNILSHLITSKPIPDATILQIERIYNILASIEKTTGVKSSYNYLVGLLEDENRSYDASIIDILASNIGILASSYNKLKAKTNITKRRNELLVSFFRKKKKQI